MNWKTWLSAHSCTWQRFFYAHGTRDFCFYFHIVQMPEFMSLAWGVYSWGMCLRFVIRKYYFCHHTYIHKFVRINLVHSCFLIYFYIISTHYQVDWKNQSVTTVRLCRLPTVSPQPGIHEALNKPTPEWLEFFTYIACF